MALLTKTEALGQLAGHRREVLRDAQGCVMCALVEGQGDPAPLLEREHGAVVLNRFASRPGHLLVIAKPHVEHASDLSWERYHEVQRMVYEASQALMAVFRPARLFSATLGASLELPMSYAHYHVHLIPVCETDERARPAHVLSWSSGVTVYTAREATALRKRILDRWPEEPVA